MLYTSPTGRPVRKFPRRSRATCLRLHLFRHSLLRRFRPGTSPSCARRCRELSRRFSEVEFERAERNQIRSELRGLDQKIRDAVQQIGARVGGLRGLGQQSSRAPTTLTLDLLKEQLWEEDLRPLLEKIDSLESVLDRIRQEPAPPRTDPRLADALLKLEARVMEMDGKIAAVREVPQGNRSLDSALGEFADLKTAVQNVTVRYSEIGDLKKNALILENQLESLKLAVDAQKAAREVPQGNGSLERALREFADLKTAVQNVTVRYSEIGDLKKNALILENQFESLKLEVDAQKAAREVPQGNGSLERALREFADLKTAVQNVTVRYSEIGDLKKNALILENQFESLKLAVDAQRKDPANGGSAKMNELQTEVLALRAEVRQSYKRISALESPAVGAAADVRALGDDLSALKNSRAEDKQALQSCTVMLAAIQKSLEETARTTAELAARAGILEADSAELTSRLAVLEQRVESLERPCEVLRAPVEDDVHSIRDNLDQIRAFMNVLARKL